MAVTGMEELGRLVVVLWVSMAKCTCTIHVNWFTYCENTARISPSVSPWSRPPAHGQRELGCVVKKLTLPQSHYFQHTHNHNGLMNQPLTMSVSSYPAIPLSTMKTTVQFHVVSRCTISRWLLQLVQHHKLYLQTLYYPLKSHSNLDEWDMC